jgi:hypothetical protein
MMKKISKRGQEEMVGFGLIIIIVALILLFLLWFSSSRSRDSVESYEVDSFVKASLQYTTECENRRDGFLDVQDLIFECVDDEECLNGRNSCEILNSTLKEMAENSYVVNAESPVKGYLFELNSDEAVMIRVEEGNTTGNAKGSKESFSKRGTKVEILFTLYS